MLHDCAWAHPFSLHLNFNCGCRNALMATKGGFYSAWVLRRIFVRGSNDNFFSARVLRRILRAPVRVSSDKKHRRGFCTGFFAHPSSRPSEVKAGTCSGRLLYHNLASRCDSPRAALGVVVTRFARSHLGLKGGPSKSVRACSHSERDDVRLSGSKRGYAARRVDLAKSLDSARVLRRLVRCCYCTSWDSHCLGD